MQRFAGATYCQLFIGQLKAALEIQHTKGEKQNGKFKLAYII